MVAKSRPLALRRSSARGIRLNTLALLVAIPTFAYALTTATPGEYAVRMHGMLAGASASLSAQVPANSYNTLAAQLTEKEARLNQREAELVQVNTTPAPSLSDNLGAISFVGSIILFILVAANFYMDIRREKKGKFFQTRFSVDLRR